jgi:hypothetical protein
LNHPNLHLASFTGVHRTRRCPRYQEAADGSLTSRFLPTESELHLL